MKHFAGGRGSAILCLGLALCLNAGRDAVRAQGRPLWTGSRLVGSPDPAPPYVAEPVFTSVRFQAPVDLASPPGRDRLFVVEKDQIWSFPNRPDAAKAEVALDLSAHEPKIAQCFGVAFHPGFATNRQMFVCYALDGGSQTGSHVSRFTVRATEPPTVDPATEEVILTWPAGGHNGGSIQFGRDGMLYVSAGDSADPSPPDPLNTGQDLSDLLSSVMRIDVDHRGAGRAYRVPTDNPFVNLAGARPEIWAYGFRNPWRISVDSATGDLWVGDVGWDLWEMIHRVQKGGNYGWSIMEGPQPVKPANPRGPTPILPPLLVHPHTEARSITGGRVYHGTRLPELQGAYIYGDYMTGRIWALRQTDGRVTWQQELAVTPVRVVAFGEDSAGELYLVNYAGGPLMRLARQPNAAANPNFPRRLSQTGLFADVAKQEPAPGVVPYSVRTEMWSDGAVAERWFAVPGTNQLSRLAVTDWETGEEEGDWRFPTNGVLVKTLSLELEPGRPASRRRLETQVLLYDGRVWHPYVYRWNTEGTEAELAGAKPDAQSFEVRDPAAPGGRRRQTWHYAAPGECVICHGMSAGGKLGFTPWQLVAPAPLRAGTEDPLQRWHRLGLLAESPKVPAFPAGTDLDGRVRAYLEVNCSHCHRPNAGGAATINARWNVPREKLGLFDAKPGQGDFGLANARLVAPGHPERSVLLLRMAKLGAGHMPHAGSSRPDLTAVRQVRDWIQQLSPDGGGTPPPVPAALRGGPIPAAAWPELLGTPGAALTTALLLDDPARRIPEATKSAVVAHAMTDAQPVVRDLFERFVPEEARAEKLGTAIQPAALLTRRGDAAAGRVVFFEVAQCGGCHQVGGQGRPIGPDLSLRVPQLTAAQILESILEPSQTIAPEYVVQLAKTRDGETTSGFLRGRTATETVLLDATGRELRIPNSEIESLTPQKLSLMPEGLLQNLTRQQAVDLLAFVSSLGKTKP